VRYEIETLISFLERLLVRASFDKDEASAIAKSLTLSERLGYSSRGIAQISRYIAELEAGNIVSGAPPKTLHETSNSLVAETPRRHEPHPALALSGQVQQARELRLRFTGGSPKGSTREI
jgi:LDH2 family malate/lactate/ureidoglycolate dehydrogenase